jgi:nucleoid-associated protein EbfC
MGMNPQKMLQQVQLMQQQMQKAQEELETATVEGSAGGGVVKATVTGKQVLTALTIDPSAVDADDVEMLQDLVMAAVNEALKASQQLAEQKMGAITSGVRIPGLL